MPTPAFPCRLSYSTISCLRVWTMAQLPLHPWHPAPSQAHLASLNACCINEQIQEHLGRVESKPSQSCAFSPLILFYSIRKLWVGMCYKVCCSRVVLLLTTVKAPVLVNDLFYATVQVNVWFLFVLLSLCPLKNGP